MSLWVVRAGKYGEQELKALQNNIVTFGWNEFSDLAKYPTKESLTNEYQRLFPKARKDTIANHIGQMWRFVHEIKIGDLVALPLYSQTVIAFGKIESDYEFNEVSSDTKHIHQVTWIKTIPRSIIDQDILHSFGVPMTIYRIERNDAEKRIKKILQVKVQI
jgi:restriction system protein